VTEWRMQIHQWLGQDWLWRESIRITRFISLCWIDLGLKHHWTKISGD